MLDNTIHNFYESKDSQRMLYETKKEIKPFHQQAFRTKLLEEEGNVMNKTY